MKTLFWAGLVVLILGVVSFFITIPRSERHGVSMGGASVGMTTRTSEKVPPAISGVMVVGGILMMIGGGRSRATA